MILAAGEGTRLRPLTLTLPKPMVPIANIPLLERTLRLVAAQGIHEVAVNLYHRPEAIRAYLGDGKALGVQIHYSLEERLMGTSGGVKQMERFLDETFLVLYGDNLWHADFSSLIAFHREKKALATIATFEAVNPSACGLVITDDGGRVTRFQEKPPPAEVFTNTANAGVYILEPEILRHIPPDTLSDFGKDIFPALVDLGTIYSCGLSGYLQDTGTAAAYRQANWDVLSGATGDTPAAPDGLLMGPDAVAATSAVFHGRNVIGTGTMIGERTTLTETIVWDNCRIGADVQITGAILGHGVTISDGAIVGDGAILADDVTVAPGVRVPDGARIEPGTTLH